MESSPSRPRDVVLLGSTGSIGTQAADVIRRNPDRFRVTGLAAGGGNPGLLAAQALGDRGMLGVDGDDLARRGQPGDQRAAHDQGLLVRQREHPARLHGGERGGEPAEPGHPVEHHVGRPGRDLGHGVRPRQNGGQRLAPHGPVLVRPAGELRQGVPHAASGRFPVHGHHRGPELQRLGRQQAGVSAPGGQRDHPELAGIAPDHIGCLGSYGTGRTEQHNIAWPGA